MYRAIIFDFFDVIRTDAVKTWYNKHGYAAEGPFFEANKKLDRGEIGVREFVNLLSNATGQTTDEIYEELEDGATIDYEVLDLIEKMRAHYAIGLLSNASSSFLRNLLREHDLERYFDEIVISSEVGLIKPEPEMFWHILDRLEVEPHEALFIDDNERNIRGAEQVGITGVQYTNLVQLRLALVKNNIYPLRTAN